MSTWLAILVGGLLTFAMRLSFIELLRGFDLPPRIGRALRLVPPAVLSAIILPELVMPSGSPDLSVHNYRLIAGCVALLVAWKTRSVVFTMLVGMSALLLLPALLK